MPQVHFYLRSGTKNAQGKMTIVMIVTHNYNRPTFSIHEKIHKKFWDKKIERAREPKPGEPEDCYKIDRNFKHINLTIERYHKKAMAIINYFRDESLPFNVAYLRCEIIAFGKDLDKAVTKEITFFGLMDEYISYSKSIQAERTITGYTTVKNFLLDFEKWSHTKISLYSIDQKFFDTLVKYSFSVRKVQDNYFAKIVRVFKSFLTWAYDRNYIADMTFRKFKATEREKEVIHLTIEELMTLFNHKFESKTYSKARDIFCFMCFTGMRPSDIQDFKHEHIQDGQIIKTIVKTTDQGIIPLNDFALAILEKYSDNPLQPLPKLSDQRLNVYIKKCCEEAKINQPVTIVKYSGGKSQQITKPKYEFITNHTGRKTFVTNSFVMKMERDTIKSITGHKKDSVFNKYLKVAEDYKKIAMDETWNVLRKKNEIDIAPKGE